MERALEKINRDEKLKRDFDLLELGKVQRGADYHSEGEILEILSYTYLLESDSFVDIISDHFQGQDFSAEDFFITGGVRYFGRNGQTLGELDVLVGDSKTCTIFGIGEAKLGRTKSKAKRQLDRIKRFIGQL